VTKVIKSAQYLVVFFSLFLTLNSHASQHEKVEEAAKTTIKEAMKEKTSVTDEIVTQSKADKKDSGDKMSNPKIKLETSKGTMMIELDAEKAPNSSANFVEYVKDGFYDVV